MTTCIKIAETVLNGNGYTEKPDMYSLCTGIPSVFPRKLRVCQENESSDTVG